MYVILIVGYLVAMIVFGAQMRQPYTYFGLHVPVLAQYQGIAVGETGTNGITYEMMVGMPQVIRGGSSRKRHKMSGHGAIEPVSQLGFHSHVGQLCVSH